MTMETVILNSPCGKIAGTRENNVCRFLGIRYAEAERFAYPREVTSWDGVYDAFSFKDAPLQKMAFDSVDCSDPANFYEHETMNGVSCTYSEDCLNLNIWAPANAEKAPVLISIFGGGEVTGRTHELPYDGTALAEKGAVVVFISYRLNIFGFLALKALEERDGKTGNYAYYDQHTAIEWVRHNISAFGGDPDNMTLAGQSAGAANCEAQIKSPLNRGYFRQAVIQSSAGFTTGLKAKDNRESEYRKWQEIYDKSGCTSLDEFIALPAERLFRLFDETSASKPGFCTTLYSEDFGGPFNNGPCDTKIMIGITSEDVFPALLYLFAGILCRSQAKAGKDTYCYYFCRQLPGDDKGAWHSADLWYFYGALKKCWRPFDEWDERLADAMQRYTLNFMRTGNPNGASLPEWKSAGKSAKNAMIFNVPECRMGKMPLLHLIRNTVSGKSTL